jgi:hypothetical protein
MFFEVSSKPDGSVVSEIIDSVKSTTCDKQDVLCVYQQIFGLGATSLEAAHENAQRH